MRILVTLTLLCITFVSMASACVPYRLDWNYVDHHLILEPDSAQGIIIIKGVADVSLEFDEMLEQLDVYVTRDGEPVTGILGPGLINNRLVWRSDESLEPEVEYVLHIIGHEGLNGLSRWNSVIRLFGNLKVYTHHPSSWLSRKQMNGRTLSMVIVYREVG